MYSSEDFLKLHKKLTIKENNNLNTDVEINAICKNMQQMEALTTPDRMYIKELCSAIIELFHSTSKVQSYYKTIHTLAFVLDSEIEKIDPDYHDWDDYDNSLDALSETDFINRMINLFDEIMCKADSADDVELLNFRPLIFDFCCEWTIREVNKA